ncbi:hypothetical protein CPB83DRAFT_908197 [Crepidotus variabilis]|uniref:Uncharacterized protein n=1 Tax=Crepidotus variabilis TaxID=179855 RepID=A0A9P6EC55_9AGAR|nr:hypothetical protein CPB83DRAFT_908197 [Crepidotus variabilis]
MVMDNLVDLTLDVAVFIAMSQSQPDGWASFECSEDCQITLTRYTFADPSRVSQQSNKSKRYTVQQLMDALDLFCDFVDTLRFRSLSMDSLSSTSVTEDQGTAISENGWSGCKHLLFVDNSSGFLARFLPVIVKRRDPFVSVSFISSGLPSLGSETTGQLRASYLYFDDLSTDARLENILGIWDGSYLNIDNCPSFGPAVLQFLTEEWPEQRFPCPSMMELTISNCKIEHYGQIDDLIEMRRKAFTLPYPGVGSNREDYVDLRREI